MRKSNRLLAIKEQRERCNVLPMDSIIAMRRDTICKRYRKCVIGPIAAPGWTSLGSSQLLPMENRIRKALEELRQ